MKKHTLLQVASNPFIFCFFVLPHHFLYSLIATLLLMSNILIISEKPSTAEKIAGSLGKHSKKQGYFEVETSKGKAFVAPAVGHLFTLKQKEKSSGYPVFDIEWVPTPEASEHFAYAEKYISTIKNLPNCQAA